METLAGAAAGGTRRRLGPSRPARRGGPWRRPHRTSDRRTATAFAGAKRLSRREKKRLCWCHSSDTPTHSRTLPDGSGSRASNASSVTGDAGKPTPTRPDHPARHAPVYATSGPPASMARPSGPPTPTGGTAHPRRTLRSGVIGQVRSDARHRWRPRSSRRADPEADRRARRRWGGHSANRRDGWVTDPFQDVAGGRRVNFGVLHREEDADGEGGPSVIRGVRAPQQARPYSTAGAAGSARVRRYGPVAPRAGASRVGSGRVGSVPDSTSCRKSKGAWDCGVGIGSNRRIGRARTSRGIAGPTWTGTRPCGQVPRNHPIPRLAAWVGNKPIKDCDLRHAVKSGGRPDFIRRDPT